MSSKPDKKLIRDWNGDPEVLRDHEQELAGDCELCREIFIDEYEAYVIGLALGRDLGRDGARRETVSLSLEEPFLAVANDVVRKLIGELGYLDITDDEFAELKRMSRDDRGVAWNLFRAARCAAQLLTYIRAPSEEEIATTFDATFGGSPEIPRADVEQ